MRGIRATVHSGAEPGVRRPRRRVDVGGLSRDRPVDAGGGFPGGAPAWQYRGRDLRRGAVHLHCADRGARDRLVRIAMRLRHGVVVLSMLVLGATASVAQTAGQTSALTKAGQALERVAQARKAKKVNGQFDPTFRKYSKRYFGPLFDWRYFKSKVFPYSTLFRSGSAE